MNIVSVFKMFPAEDGCIAHIEKVRWGDTPKCPYCKSPKTTPMPKENRHHCNNCNTSFSVTVGTIFHHTHLPLQKWFLAISIILNAKKGLSARQLGRDLEVNKDTAWRMAMKIREAMAEREQRELLSGIVEVDETYIGGKPRKGGGGSSPKLKRGRGTKKTPVVGMVARNGKVKAKIMRRLRNRDLKALIKGHVDIENTILMTDEFGGYARMRLIMPHKIINHKIGYACGDIHTNTIESFWALLKRGIVGQYHKVSVRHLPKYIDEFSYRWNHREIPDLFMQTLKRAMR